MARHALSAPVVNLTDGGRKSESRPHDECRPGSGRRASPAVCGLDPALVADVTHLLAVVGRVVRSRAVTHRTVVWSEDERLRRDSHAFIR